MIKTHSLKYYVLTGIVIFTALVLSIVVYIIMPRGKPVALQEPSGLFSIVRDGDVICRLGDRLWSLYFKDVSPADKRYSHMGIIRINNGVITVIHAEGDTGHGRDFVNEVPLEDFIKTARAIGVYRIKDTDGKELSNLALEYLGIPFDWQFNMFDDSKLYCTELLYVLLQRINPALVLKTRYIRELKKEIIPLDAVSDSENFSEVYYSGNY